MTKTAARGPYRSGLETRERLLHTALSLFSRLGFEATSTRAIAAGADVTIPAITYHFGSKNGLYLACADHVLERYSERMGGLLTRLFLRLPDLAPAEAREALVQITTMLLKMFGDDRRDDTWIDFMLRVMNEPGQAHDRLYNGLWKPGLLFIAGLIARCRGRKVTLVEDRLEALLLLSTPSIFNFARPVALNFGGWPDIDATLLGDVAQHLRTRIANL